MKSNKIIYFLLIVLIVIVTISRLNDISNFLAEYFKVNPKLVILPNNEYTKEQDYLLVQPSDDYVPYSYNDLLNIFYSVINNGWTKFTFYCPSEYEDCIKDVAAINDNSELLTHLNNYTHPFNNFSDLVTAYDETGEVTIELHHLYSPDKIELIDKKTDEIINNLITPDMDDNTKILTIHDYIINNAKYDRDKNDSGTSIYDSNTAYGPLFQGWSICGGYADSMAIILTKLGYDNYKIASSSHVWNAVYYDGKWVHLDLTWDDPVSDTGKDYLYHKYFLINNDELQKADGDLKNHVFNKAIYLEFR